MVGSFKELKKLFPAKKISLTIVDEKYSDIQEFKRNLPDLLYPLDSKLDYSIGLVVKLASAGIGINYETKEKRIAKSKIFLSGLGADELFFGYERYKNYYFESTEKLIEEAFIDRERSWVRNLARDDRIISTQEKELRLPYFHKELWDFVVNIPAEYNVSFICRDEINSFRSKLILRNLAKDKGLMTCSVYIKKRVKFNSMGELP